MKESRGWLYILLAASLTLSVLFALRVPLNGNPDESSHRDYIRLLIENRGFVKFVPTPFDTDFGDRPTPWETHQPPLYYLLCVPVHLASGGSVFAVRMVAVALQLLTVFVVFRACRDLFPEKPYLAVGAAAFAAFLPTQAQLSASISNDSLTTLLCAAMFWQLGVLVKRGQPVAGALALGVLLGLGLLTKVSVLQLLPAFAVAYFLATRATLLTTREAIGRLALSVGLGVVLASPWLLRNMTLYGDLLALAIYKLTGPNFSPDQILVLTEQLKAAGRLETPWTMVDYLRNVGVRSYATFWYILSPNLPFNQFTGPAWQLVTVLALGLGGAFGAYKWSKTKKENPFARSVGSKPDGNEVVSSERRVMVLFALGIALMVPFFTQFVLSVFQAQGRYFLPILLPAATLCVLGWSEIAGERKEAIAAACVGGVLLLLSLYQLLIIA